VKLGIGGKPEQWDLADWVLAPFMGDDAKAFEQVLDKMEDLCALLVQGKTDEAMNRYSKTV
jgi:PTH1 family peptidyl-tRNA hydrolase